MAYLRLSRLASPFAVVSSWWNREDVAKKQDAKKVSVEDCVHIRQHLVKLLSYKKCGCDFLSWLGKPMVEEYITVFKFLDAADAKCPGEGGSGCSPYWATLKATLDNDAAFIAYARSLAHQVRKAENKEWNEAAMARDLNYALVDKLRQNRRPRNDPYYELSLAISRLLACLNLRD